MYLRFNKRCFIVMCSVMFFTFSVCAKGSESLSAKKEKSIKVDKLEKLSLVELVTMYRPDFLLGTHTKAIQVSGVGKYKKSSEIIAKEYNLVSVGIYQKSIQRKSQTDWDFGGVDPIINFSKKKDLKVYAHPMFGSNGYIPDWLMKGDYSNEELLEIIENRIKTVLTKHKGDIDILDVYNEGFSRSSPEWRKPDNLFLSLGWHENEIGRWPVFLEKMLVWCRQYGGKDLKLIYNDNHNTLFGMPQSLACIQLYKALKKEGIPIDGIGIQCHTKITAEGKHMLSASASSIGPMFDAELFAKNLKSFGDAGIDIYISESDIHLYGEIDEAKLALQAQAYRSILKACLEAPACKSFKTWGFTDASCWKPMKKELKTAEYEPYPLPFDHKLNPKPAYKAMKELVISLIMDGKQ